MSTGCSDPNFCRGGCCRNFFGTQFCDVQSNCVSSPTWLVALVPAMLGVAALVLIILVFVRLKNRKVIQIYDKIGNAEQQGREYDPKYSDKNQLASDRPLRSNM